MLVYLAGYIEIPGAPNFKGSRVLGTNIGLEIIQI